MESQHILTEAYVSAEGQRERSSLLQNSFKTVVSGKTGLGLRLLAPSLNALSTIL